MEATNTAIETVEVATAEVISAPEQPTKEDLKKSGWSADEILSATKRGMIKDKEEVVQEKKVEAKEETKPVAEAVVPESHAETEKKKSSLPSFDLTPEQEKVFLDTFGPGSSPRGIYFRMKNERTARQNAESEKERLAKEVEELRAAKQGKVADESIDDILGDGGEDPDENKPLTIKEFKELQRKEEERKRAESEQMSKRVSVVTEAQKDQEEYARTVYQDFDDTILLAQSVINDLESILPEKHKQAKAIKLFRDLQQAAANADKYGIEDYNAAMIGYELGQLHPSYGKANGHTPDSNGAEKPARSIGDHTAEKLKRIEVNAQRRPASASLPGGSGKRTVLADEVTLEQLARMSTSERLRFREKHPDNYAKLAHG